MEKYKDIQGFEGIYQISNFGNVKSLSREKLLPCNKKYICKDRLLNIHLDRTNGYKIVGLSKNGIEKKFKVHRIIADNFIPNPENKPYINHINGIKSDNRIENLEWVTGSENVKHAYSIGLSKKKYGSKHHNSKTSEKENRFIKLNLNNNLMSVDELAVKFKVNKETIYRISNRKYE